MSKTNKKIVKAINNIFIDPKNTKIYYGAKRKYLEISPKSVFCIYDGFGGFTGRVVKKKNIDVLLVHCKQATITEIMESKTILEKELFSAMLSYICNDS